MTGRSGREKPEAVRVRKERRWLKPRAAVPAQNDALAHAMAMVAVPVLFGFLGSLIDRAIGTGPILLIGFAALGVVGSFASAYYRYEARIAEQDVDKPWTRARSRAVSQERSGGAACR
jgi:F0F1-type ATP synthase assembly protein I